MARLGTPHKVVRILIYKRAPGKVGGQYGSIFSADQLASPVEPVSQPPGPTSQPPAPIDPFAAKNRAYQQERARVEAMVKANPDMQKQEIADARAKVRDMGMATWAAANPTLAKISNLDKLATKLFSKL